ncbi:EF-hand domain-containing protein [Luteimonas sp. SDU82]|uniref:EF-hand domain-containing protein n=1 Tax=Luteimonas sp. SDU82 TaxID=3422592 RepID=UPI003EBB7843
MKHRTLFTALALVAMAGGTAAAQPADAAQRGAKATLDRNGDGVIDRAEAAAFPRLAERFDRLDRNGDGRLDASERPQHRHGRRGGKGGPHRGHHDPAHLDGDGDGRLSRAEVDAAGAGRGRRAGRLAEHFDAIDGNRDGYLVRGEIRAWHERQRPQREAQMRKRFDERFVAADLNGDGRLSRVEVEEKMPRLAKRFAWMDDNRDGFLSRDELQPKRG